MSQTPQTIEVAEGGYTFPIKEILTGRGFCSGKSGSGKTNTVSVIVERLLDKDLPLLIIDTEGEYYPLKESFEILHVGPSEENHDRGISPGEVSDIVDISLHQNVPVILDVSEFEEEEESKTVVEQTLDRLFSKEKSVEKPYLIVVEEIHEYVPEKGGFDSLAEKIVRIAKRGRKRGLGICGVSQRPAAVAKDFITQCGWLVWHRLTWENDVDVARRILGSEYGDMITELETGEAFVLADWRPEIDRVKFLRKQTYDAGSTPGLEAIEQTTVSEMDEELTEDIKPTVEGQSTEELKQTLREREERISELEAEIQRLESNESDGQYDTKGNTEDDPIEEVKRESKDDLLLEFSSLFIHITALLTRRMVMAVQGISARLTDAIHVVDGGYEARATKRKTTFRRALLLTTIVVMLSLAGFLLWTGITAIAG